MSFTATQQLTTAVLHWPGTSVRLGQRGEYGFDAHGIDLGHLHGDRVAHFGFPRAVGAALRAAGRVGPHPVNPHSPKMAARDLRTQEDIDDVLGLLRLNYERDVRATVQALDAAQDDADAFCALLTEDASVINVAGRRVQGREALRRIMTEALDGDLAAVRTHLDVEAVTFLSAQTAIVTATKSIDDRRPDADDALPTVGTLTVTLVHTPEGWRAAALQTTPVAGTST